MYAQTKVKNVFDQFSKINNILGLSGAQIAVLRAAALIYFAAAAMSFANLARLLTLSGFYNERG